MSSNHESAFPIAAVAVGVCREHPDLLDVLLAHFYRVCPYLVPYYIPKTDGQSTEQYYRYGVSRVSVSGAMLQVRRVMKEVSGLVVLHISLSACGLHVTCGSPAVWSSGLKLGSMAVRMDISFCTNSKLVAKSR